MDTKKIATSIKISLVVVVFLLGTFVGVYHFFARDLIPEKVLRDGSLELVP